MTKQGVHTKFSSPQTQLGLSPSHVRDISTSKLTNGMANICVELIDARISCVRAALALWAHLQKQKQKRNKTSATWDLYCVDCIIHSVDSKARP